MRALRARAAKSVFSLATLPSPPPFTPFWEQGTSNYIPGIYSYKVPLRDAGRCEIPGVTHIEKGHAGDTGSHSLCWRQYIAVAVTRTVATEIMSGAVL